ncbi:MAG: bifunctional phosphopantothenoylcysteine decarboxylase/phosphopantothenate--cysteine ligase CoaBC [Microscillaceae bacterium]
MSENRALTGKKILLGVSGSIAAYKAALLVRDLVRAGAEVKVLMTPAARDFISPLTLGTLSNHPVLTDFVANIEEGTWNNHVALGLWADAFVIAPATATTLAKCATGQADNLLTAVYLSARCPVFFAPAMDLDMYQHPATRQNLQKLQSYGNYIIPAGHGELASGLVGEGRLAEPSEIVAYLIQVLAPSQPLAGKIVLLTAGPTQEAIDPVRFISNHSSGKMGYALAETAARRGARVILVSGPTSLSLSHPQIQKWEVRSAREMFEATQANFEQADFIILTAAVADFTPQNAAEQKIKKKEGADTLHIPLIKTVDIAQYIGTHKKPGQVLVGFALETENELENARAKMQRKNFDLIVLNSLRNEGAGFGHDTNQVTLLGKEDLQIDFPLQSKPALAEALWENILRYSPGMV